MLISISAMYEQYSFKFEIHVLHVIQSIVTMCNKTALLQV